MDCSPPGSSVHEILQARILEWVALPFSRDLSNPEIKPRSPALQVDSFPAEPQGKTFMQDSKRDREIKNRLLDSVEEGEGGMV